SFQMSHLIVKTKKPHTIGESIIKPALQIFSKLFCNEEQMQIAQDISLSNSTVARRIEDMSDDILKQLIPKIQHSPKFAIQLDCAKDSAQRMFLSCFVRYIDNTNENPFMCEDFLFCKEMKKRKTGEAMFNIIENFFQENSINIKNCCGLSTDGAQEMRGKKTGLHGLFK